MECDNCGRAVPALGIRSNFRSNEVAGVVLCNRAGCLPILLKAKYGDITV